MTETAFHFRVGQRVTMTHEGIMAGIQGTKNRRNGVVKEIVTRDGQEFLKIRRDGETLTHIYHLDFWQHDLREPEAIADDNRRCPTCGQKLP